MDRYGGHQTVLIIALHVGIYLAIIMSRCREPHTSLTIALYGGFELAIIMERLGFPQTALNIVWH
jgi:hypothetical protein